MATVHDYEDFYHTGPGTLAGRYLRMFWQPVSRAKDLVPGKAKPVQLMSERFTLYRGASGKAYLVDFGCAHRGTQLSTGWVEGECIRCRYHGWKYEGNGQCDNNSSFSGRLHRIQNLQKSGKTGIMLPPAALNFNPPPPKRNTFGYGYVELGGITNVCLW